MVQSVVTSHTITKALLLLRWLSGQEFNNAVQRQLVVHVAEARLQATIKPYHSTYRIRRIDIFNCVYTARVEHAEQTLVVPLSYWLLCCACICLCACACVCRAAGWGGGGGAEEISPVDGCGRTLWPR